MKNLNRIVFINSKYNSSARINLFITKQLLSNDVLENLQYFEIFLRFLKLTEMMLLKQIHKNKLNKTYKIVIKLK